MKKLITTAALSLMAVTSVIAECVPNQFPDFEYFKNAKEKVIQRLECIDTTETFDSSLVITEEFDIRDIYIKNGNQFLIKTASFDVYGKKIGRTRRVGYFQYSSNGQKAFFFNNDRSLKSLYQISEDGCVSEKVSLTEDQKQVQTSFNFDTYLDNQFSQTTIIEDEKSKIVRKCLVTTFAM